MSSSPEGLAQLETMIKRYRNNPAIFLWSMGNEEDVLQANEIGPQVLQTMQKHAHELDPTASAQRPSTAPMTSRSPPSST